jgi:CRP/FNR family cyclic AMP-dependent transcriptional regulator
MKHLAVFRRGEASAVGQDDDLLHLPRWGETDWHCLFGYAAVTEARTSTIVIQRGSTDRAVYFVADGSLEVGTSYVDGMSMSPLAKINPGSVVGEQSFFDGMPRSASVWVVTDCTLLKLPFDRYEAFADANPLLGRELVFALGRILSARLRNTTMRIRR